MLRNWIVITVLALIGVALSYFWFTLPQVDPSVTPKGGTEDMVTAIAAFAGAITTFGAAIFGVLGKYNEYTKAKLEIEEKRIDLDRKKQGDAGKD